MKMKSWIKTHWGFLALIPLCALCVRYPLFHGGTLPNPWETLFDWSGEVGAMTYKLIVAFALNFSLPILLAGILDRCPLRDTVILMSILILSLGLWAFIYLGWFASSDLLFPLTGALLWSWAVYLIARKLTGIVLRWRTSRSKA